MLKSERQSKLQNSGDLSLEVLLLASCENFSSLRKTGQYFYIHFFFLAKILISSLEVWIYLPDLSGCWHEGQGSPE